MQHQGLRQMPLNKVSMWTNLYQKTPKAQYARKYTKEFKSQYSMQKKLQLSESNHKDF